MSKSCLDRISSLPDELLSQILSLLPSTRCAVRTSILSTRWRYLFTLTTSLSFDVAPFLSHPGVDEKTEATQRFKEFVDKVLELHQIPYIINKFSLLCRGSNEKHLDLKRWLSSAVQKGVQELHYELPEHIHGRARIARDCVPDEVFFCETLVKLTMIGFVSGYNRIQIPLSVWLPKLKIIDLDNIKFLDSMNRLFSSFEALEELTLRYCHYKDGDDIVYRSGVLRVLTIEYCNFMDVTFEVDAPNLAYLTYISNNGIKIAPSWKYSGSFVEAKLMFDYCADCLFDIDQYSIEHERELLKAVADKTTELRFEEDSLEVLLMVEENEEMPDFSNLTKLVLGHFRGLSWKYVTSLIDKCPRLETLIFEMGFQCCCWEYYYHDYFARYCDSLSPSDIPLDPFSCQVQSIEVHGFCGHKSSWLLTGHLLSNASALKKMIIYRDDDNYLDLEGQVSMLPRASKDSCIEIKRATTR